MNISCIRDALKNICKCIVKQHGMLIAVFYVREDFPVCAYDTAAHVWIGLGECFTGTQDIRKAIYTALGVTKLNTVLSFEDLCKVVDNGNITCLLNGEENA